MKHFSGGEGRAQGGVFWRGAADMAKANCGTRGGGGGIGHEHVFSWTGYRNPIPFVSLCLDFCFLR